MSEVNKKWLYLSIFFIIFTSSFTSAAITCNFSTVCAYPSFPAFYSQNETGGFDNAHSQNTTLISLQGLTTWWRLDNSSSIGENNSRVFDWSGSQINGTSLNGAAPNSSGNIGGAYDFDGVNDLVDFGPGKITDKLNGTSSISVSMWIKPAFHPAAGVRARALNINIGGALNGLLIGLIGGSVEALGRSTSAEGFQTVNSGSINATPNTWTHVVGILDFPNDKIYLYINGTLNSQGNVTFTNNFYTNGTAYTANDSIGGRSNTGSAPDQLFNGSIDDIMIFNRSLSSTEILLLYNQTYKRYNYALCCSATEANLSADICSPLGATVVKLANYTNSHVQTGNYTGTPYTYPVCLSSSIGRVQCVYSDSACNSGYDCVASISSSENGDLNLTNSHVGSCPEYGKKICCRVNTPPKINNLILNSTLGTNLTTENLTVYFNESDFEADNYTNITDWRVNGTSIAVLNLPFNTEETRTNLKAIRDYSTNGNNATLGALIASQAPNWTANGKSGGAYDLDGVNDFISINNSASLNPSQLSVSAWVKSKNDTAWSAFGCFVSKRDAYVLHPDLNTKNVRGIIINSTGSQFSAYTPTVTNISLWHLYTMTFNGSYVVSYLDGVPGTPTAVNGGVTTNDTGVVEIGRDDGNTGRLCNITIDEVQIYNRSLSAGQVLELYNAGNNNLSLQKIHSAETFGGENWTVAVTGNDRADGETNLSNSLVIRNSAPTVTLTSPASGSATTNRTPLFNWTGFDADGDSLTYEINITAFLETGTSTCTDVRSQTIGTEYYFTSGDLLCLKDNGLYYAWSVRANDGSQFGPWSSVRTINITALQAISLPVKSIEFGSMTILQSNDTTDDIPPPFTVQNDGNSLLNINVSATALWQSVAASNIYYRFKVDNVTGETNAFNWSGSTTSFTNTPTSEILAIHRLNYSNIRDIAETDLYVQVPPNEPSAIRNSTMTFFSYLGET